MPHGDLLIVSTLLGPDYCLGILSLSANLCLLADRLELPCLPACLPACLSLPVSACLCLSVRPSVRPSVRLSVCLSECLSELQLLVCLLALSAAVILSQTSYCLLICSCMLCYLKIVWPASDVLCVAVTDIVVVQGLYLPAPFRLHSVKQLVVSSDKKNFQPPPLCRPLLPVWTCTI